VAAISTWFAMGGYALYVWPAYGLAGAVLGGMSAYLWRRYRDSVRSLGRLQSRATRR
jgi:heme exporter protein D